MLLSCLVSVCGVISLLLGATKLVAMNQQLTTMSDVVIEVKKPLTSKRIVQGAFVVAISMTVLLYILTIKYATFLPKPLLNVLMILGGLIVAANSIILFSMLFATRRMQVVAVVLSVAAIAIWWLWPSWLTVDLLAIVVVLGALGWNARVTLNFKLVSMFGAFFGYDILNVFGTGRMQKMAELSLESPRPLPTMVIVPAELSLDARWSGILGLGDILVPGALIVIGSVLARRQHKSVILYASLAGYAVGMVLALIAVERSGLAQPALLYLYPCVMASILFAAWRTGNLNALLEIKHLPRSGGQADKTDKPTAETPI